MGTGASIFEQMAKMMGIDPSQLTFLLCQATAVLFGYLMRKCLPPSVRLAKYRHALELIVGLAILYSAYGLSILHLLAQAVPAYLMLVFLPLSVAQYGILVFSLLYLSAVHIYLLTTDSQASHSDISAPLMIQTQKLSSLAFNINDGMKLAAGSTEVKERHKVNAIDRRPRLLQLGGFLLCFHNSMIGPSMFFADYIRFIEGREEERLGDSKPEDREAFRRQKDEIRSAGAEVWNQVKLLIIHTFLFLWAAGNFEPDRLLSDEFSRKNFVQKYIYLSIACFGFRQRFYFAWTLSCLANLSAGFGFSGFDHQGRPEYRLATNIYFLPIELGTCTKTILDAWNTATTRWLRDCIYDRVPRRYAIWAVFVASAIWHGFHPGYYLAFISASVVTVAGRVCRKCLRPYFVRSRMLHYFYDVLTHLSAMFVLNYLGIAFLLQRTHKVLTFWKHLRFLGHIGPLSLIVCLPLVCGKLNDFHNGAASAASGVARPAQQTSPRRRQAYDSEDDELAESPRIEVVGCGLVDRRDSSN